MVTDWNPLTVWMYAEPYIRFPAMDFSFTKMNNYAHLSNHSVAKHAGQEENNEHEIEGNMWSLDEFIDHLQEENGYDVWTDLIQGRIKKMVSNTLFTRISRKCCFHNLLVGIPAPWEAPAPLPSRALGWVERGAAAAGTL